MKFPRNIRADTVTAFEMYHSLTDFNLSDIAKMNRSYKMLKSVGKNGDVGGMQ